MPLAPARIRLPSSCLARDKVDYHISPNCKEREFFAERSSKAERLTEEELKQVMTHDFEDADLAFVRDIFVFICWTALAFVDVKNLTTDDIVDINGDKWIVSHRHI